MSDLQTADEKQISEQELMLHQEEFDSIQEQLEELFDEHTKGDYADNDKSPIAKHAAEIANAHITGGTRKAQRRQFILQKCGDRAHGYEGCKFPTAVSTRAALTMWYRSLRPNESTIEWSQDKVSGQWRGLPTRSRIVAEFMVGLEKTKAKAGEISQSARALNQEDFHRMHDLCINSSQTLAEKKQGSVRYAAYLLAFLMMLRIDEVVSLTFESLDKIPQERTYFDVRLSTRKSAQTGVLHSWRLHANDQDIKMCPMRAIIRLRLAYGDSKVPTGPFFLKVNGYGAITDDPITNTVLGKALTQDLQKLGYSAWALYGTHSFRRGGCQYRIRVKDWTVDQVAIWGGWSQVEAITMFRYFYSPNDNHEYMNDYDRNDGQSKRVRY
ncbi:hypothetical protein FIBSPDRAFT_902846 [Athelia psychrophila]|uniref:DNA breaking-rejoining enzyme n=1 Tax=Athelia psychrophila TaxID=1759441 RepID=A0A167WQ64_9AGAM|nr:hypothetical protein FIBSPDRAFT_902846 [Fibularhizoctonia sp. CBS 109695]